MEQLRALERALLDLIPVARKLEVTQVPQYESALDRTRSLIANGFTQVDLTGLGTHVPDVFQRHKDWVPPLEQYADGTWAEPAWFQELEEKLQPTLRAAGKLPILGFY